MSQHLQELTEQLKDITKEPKAWDIWVEGYSCSPDSFEASLHGTVVATTFEEACAVHALGLNAVAKAFWSFDGNARRWSFWGCKAFDNEADARKSFG